MARFGNLRGPGVHWLVAGALIATACAEEPTPSQAEDSSGTDSAGDTDTGGDDGAPSVPATACHDYLSWDGVEFVDIDECARDVDVCGDPAVFACVNQVGAPPRCVWDTTETYLALTNGVNEIPGFVGPPNASALVLFDDRSAPIVTSGGSVLAAAGTLDAGRIFAIGHPDYLDAELGNLDTLRLVENAVGWAGQGETASLVVGVAPSLIAAAEALAAGGWTVVTAELDELDGLDVYIPDAKTLDTPGTSVLIEFAREGGGIVVGAEAMTLGTWGVAVNNLLFEAGMLAVQRAVGGVDPVAATPPPMVHNAAAALDLLGDDQLDGAILSDEMSDVARAAADIGLEELPIGFVFEGWFCRAERFADLHGDVIPTRADPVNAFAQPDRALALRIDMKLQDERSPEYVRAHESVPDYPGAVASGATSVPVTVTIDGTFEGRDPRYLYAAAQEAGWRTTGLYAQAGEPITVTVPEGAAGQGLRVQIGVHGDDLWSLSDWERVPRLLKSRPLSSTTTTLASGFGGPVIIRVPVGSALGPVTLDIEGAYAAPRWVVGETSADEWVEARQAPAPWASLETSKIIFFVNADLVRTLEDPTVLMGTWDAVMDADATLSAIPSERPRAEIVVADRQISAGWMHSGYPIMSNIDASPTFVDLEHLLSEGEWGVLHELGHNHQWNLMQLPGAVECTVNLWSVYASEEVLGIDRANAHPALAPADRSARIDAYLAGGSDFEADWNVWTCLETYLQLEEGFGWAPHIAMFESLYYPLPPSTSWDTTTRASEYAVAFSNEVGRDLGPFFTAWGWPLSPESLTAMAMLPPWDADPMN